jgi:hypothetical protein
VEDGSRKYVNQSGKLSWSMEVKVLTEVEVGGGKWK